MIDARSDRKTSWRRRAIGIAVGGLALAAASYAGRAAVTSPAPSEMRTDGKEDRMANERVPGIARPGCCLNITLSNGEPDQVCQSMSAQACLSAGGQPTLGCGNGSRGRTGNPCRSRITTEEPEVSDATETVVPE